MPRTVLCTYPRRELGNTGSVVRRGVETAQWLTVTVRSPIHTPLDDLETQVVLSGSSEGLHSFM